MEAKSLEQVCAGIRMAGEGLIMAGQGLVGLSDELKGGSIGFKAPVTQENKPAVETKKPTVETKKPEAKTVEKKEEVKPVDFAALRKEGTEKLLKAVQAGHKQKIVDQLTKLNAKKIGEVAEADLAGFVDFLNGLMV
jgi:hypothetical protein